MKVSNEVAAEPFRPSDVFAGDCPSRLILEHLTSRWGVLVLIALLDGVMRFSALRRRLPGVSEKMLTQTLRTLERDGLVRRHALPVIPPHVDYDLTPLGEEAARQVRALAYWTEAHVPEVTAARAEYDATHATHATHATPAAHATPATPAAH